MEKMDFGASSSCVRIVVPSCQAHFTQASTVPVLAEKRILLGNLAVNVIKLTDGFVSHREPSAFNSQSARV